MVDMQRYESDAKFLASCITTHWDNYDFSERTEDAERRVPRIVFNDVAIPISVTPKEAEHVKGFAYEKFIRRYEVEYRDGKYIFVLTVDAPLGRVREYKLSVMLVTDMELKTLYSERIERIK